MNEAPDDHEVREGSLGASPASLRGCQAVVHRQGHQPVYLPKEAQDELRARLRTYRNEGLFTPPSFEGSVEKPGHNGGTNFGTSAVDPDRGEFYVVHKSLPTMIRISRPAAADVIMLLD